MASMESHEPALAITHEKMGENTAHIRSSQIRAGGTFGLRNPLWDRPNLWLARLAHPQRNPTRRPFALTPSRPITLLCANIHNPFAKFSVGS